MVIKPAGLKRLVREILIHSGASQPNAECVADHLVSANLSGIDTHGVWHVPIYVNSIRVGELMPAATPELSFETATAILVKGNWTFGQVAARYAMERVIAKVKQSGIAVASLVQAHHIGRLGDYVEMAAAEGMISIVVAGGFGVENPAAVPYGGRQRFFGTNPFAAGFPAGQEPRIMFDFATTASSGVKLQAAKKKGETVPLGWIVDKEGIPTRDPNAFFDGGAQVPFGEHKGYAFMVASEVLGRVFSGGDAFAESNCGGTNFRHQGATMIVIKANLFQPMEKYADRVDELQRQVRAVAPAPGFEQVLVPGDPERHTRAVRQRDGVPVPEPLWDEISDLARSLGLQLGDFDS